MGKVLHLGKVTEALREQGIPAYVEQTGGGVATIYAGESFERQEPRYVWRPVTGDEGPDAIVSDGKVRILDGTTTETRYPCIAGPGWFEGAWVDANARAHTDEFAIGLDDDGESEYSADETWTEEDVVREISKVVKTGSVG
jgi:hypothetical protein